MLLGLCVCACGVLTEDEFMIIACDGVFDVISCQEAVNCVRNHLREGGTAEGAAKALCTFAYDRRSLDNLSAVVAVFQSPQGFLQQQKEIQQNMMRGGGAGDDYALYRGGAGGMGNMMPRTHTAATTNTEGVSSYDASSRGAGPPLTRESGGRGTCTGGGGGAGSSYVSSSDGEKSGGPSAAGQNSSTSTSRPAGSSSSSSAFGRSGTARSGVGAFLLGLMKESSSAGVPHGGEGAESEEDGTRRFLFGAATQQARGGGGEGGSSSATSSNSSSSGTTRRRINFAALKGLL